MLIGFLASCSSKKTVSSHKRVNNVYVDADEAQDANKPIEASKKQNKKTSSPIVVKKLKRPTLFYKI